MRLTIQFGALGDIFVDQKERRRVCPFIAQGIERLRARPRHVRSVVEHQVNGLRASSADPPYGSEQDERLERQRKNIEGDKTTAHAIARTMITDIATTIVWPDSHWILVYLQKV